MPEQIPVQFDFQSNQSFSTFYPGNNEEIINHLQKIFINNEQQIFLWGDRGSGKTHLLQALGQESNACNKTSFYYSLDTDNLPDPAMLEGLEKKKFMIIPGLKARLTWRLTRWLPGVLQWHMDKVVRKMSTTTGS